MVVSRKSKMRKNSKTRGKTNSKRTLRKNFVNRKTKVMQRGGGLEKAQKKAAAKLVKREAKAARSQAKSDFLQKISKNQYINSVGLSRNILTPKQILSASNVYKKLHMLAANPTYKPRKWYGRALSNTEKNTAKQKLQKVLDEKYGIKTNNSGKLFGTVYETPTRLGSVNPGASLYVPVADQQTYGTNNETIKFGESGRGIMPIPGYKPYTHGSPESPEYAVVNKPPYIVYQGTTPYYVPRAAIGNLTRTPSIRVTGFDTGSSTTETPYAFQTPKNLHVSGY